MEARVASLPAPTGGWNAYNAFAAMQPIDAVQMDNFFPETSYVRLRKGYQSFCATGASGAVKTLMEYQGGASAKFLAAADGKIYEVSTGTASTLATGFASDVWQSVSYSTAGGKYLIFANDSGTDKPQVYDGATVAAVAVTGVTDTDLSMVVAYASRMFYVRRNTLSVWYTTAAAYQGALTEFNFGPICTRGGRISAIGTWTRDNGYGGGDDLLVIVTTMGEVLGYSGTNPADATAWSLVGRFVVGRPVSGPHSLFRTGPDLMILNEDGYQPLSTYMTTGQTEALKTNLAAKIGLAAGAAVHSYKGNVGWQGLVYPQGSQIIVNVPTTNTTFQQHVVNTETGAWCRYLGIPSYCWSLFNSVPYFGGAAGVVYQWDLGLSDNGADIVGELVTSFQYIGGRGKLKRYTMARPQVSVPGTLTYSLGMEVDFVVGAALPTVNSNSSSVGTWDSAIWDSSTWDVAPALQRRWVSVSGLGYAAAVHMKVSTHTQSVSIFGFDVAFAPGGFI